LVAVEAICFSCSLAFLLLGMPALAVAALIVPLQVVAWCVLSGSELHVLYYFVLMWPLATVSFLPSSFGRNLLYPGTILILLVLRQQWVVQGKTASRRPLSSGARIPLILLAAVLIVSTVRAVLTHQTNAHTVYYTVLVLQVAVLGYLVTTSPCSTSDVRRMLVASVAAAVFMAALVPFLGGRTGSGVAGFEGSKVLTAFFGEFDLNTFGGIVAICAAVLVGLLFSERRSVVRGFEVAAIGVLVFALVATRSRGAWLGLGAAGLYVVLRARSLGTTLVSAVAALALLSFDVLRNTLSTRLAQTSVRDASLAGRAALWQFAINAARSNWLFGLGMENFRVQKLQYGFPRIGTAEMMRYNTHNLYLEFLVDLGIVGLAVLLLLLGGAFFVNDALARERRDHSGLALALNAGLIAFAVHGLVDCLTETFMLPAILLGLSAALRRVTTELPDRVGGRARCV
jgi:O-antigen ligase